MAKKGVRSFAPPCWLAVRSFAPIFFALTGQTDRGRGRGDRPQPSRRVRWDEVLLSVHFFPSVCRAEF